MVRALDEADAVAQFKAGWHMRGLGRLPDSITATPRCVEACPRGWDHV